MTDFYLSSDSWILHTLFTLLVFAVMNNTAPVVLLLR